MNFIYKPAPKNTKRPDKPTPEPPEKKYDKLGRKIK